MPSRRQLWLLAVAAVCGAIVVAIFPFRLVPPWPHDDAVAHLLSGVALAAIGAAATRRVDDHIALSALGVGIGWELVESVWFACYLDGRPCLPALADWFLLEDTLFDVTLVVLGAGLLLVVIGRYN